MPRQVIIDFDENGNPEIDGKGFAGPECEKIINEISNSIGQKISVTNHPEFLRRASVGGRQAQSNKR